MNNTFEYWFTRHIYCINNGSLKLNEVTFSLIELLKLWECHKLYPGQLYVGKLVKNVI